MAVRWLERAHDVLGSHELERFSMDAGQLRLTIMQSLGNRSFIFLDGQRLTKSSPGFARIKR